MPSSQPPAPPRVGVILTVHNRVEMTLRCLGSVWAQDAVADVALEVVLVDDGSTDGTARRVAEAYPQVTVLQGDGQLFWNGGMRRAWAEVHARDVDFTLWLNDDTELYPHALRTLMSTYVDVAGVRSDPGSDAPSGDEAPVVVAGAIADPQTSRVNYAGVRQDRWRRLAFHLVEPIGQPQAVDTMNGNAVLVPRAVTRRIGTLSRAYTHAMGDFDYGLRLQRAGGQVWMTPSVIGECPSNPGFVAEGDARTDWQRLHGTKHLPAGEWQTFAMRWAGPAWPLYWMSPYLRRLTWILRARVRRLRASQPA